MAQVENAGLFAPSGQGHRSTRCRAEYRPSTGKWTGIAARSTVFVYDKSKLQRGQAAQVACWTWPSPSGRATGPPRRRAPTSRRSSRALLELKGEAATQEWLKGMKANAKAYKGNSTVMKAVNAGEVDAALIYHYYYYGDQAKTGENSKNVTLYYFKNQDPGAFVSPSPAAAC